WNLLWRRQEASLSVNSRLLPNDALLLAAQSLSQGKGLRQGGQDLVWHGQADRVEWSNWDGEAEWITHPEDVFLKNGSQIRRDVNWLLEAGGEWALPAWSQRVDPDPHTAVYRPDQVYVHPSAIVRAAVLDASEGPIWIGESAEIMAGSMIKGPVAIGEHSSIKMGAKIYGDSTVGPYCKVGGEVSNSVIHSYSNKGHDGFMGNSVIGRWCNWGADTNNSNLKNNYEQVKLWDIATGTFRNTGLTFCGLIMGDHSKCGINTMFNTGTVVGVGANIFGGGFVRQFIPSFGWGGTQGMETFRFDKFAQTAEKVMQRRGLALSIEERDLLQHIYEATAVQRTWEKK
ncbi:MAG: putative sugar nucleotidyl transferase, partial [Bacteroidota bacterium]